MDNALLQVQNEFVNKLGSEIATFSFNEQMHRKGSLWAIGKEWDYKGNHYCLVNYGDWKSGIKYTWKNFNPGEQTKQFHKSFKEKVEGMKAIQRLESQKKNETCRQKWKPIFENATSKSEPHPYLEGKQLSSNYTARIDNNGTLLIPAYDAEKFVGVQMIFWGKDDPEDENAQEKWIKRFSSGIKLDGSFSYIGDIRNSEVVYIAEGFATAASINEITGHAVLITFNCHNIYKAVKTLRDINRYCRVIICADNDRNRVNHYTGKKENIGVIRAKYTARKISNCIVRVPRFPSGHDDLTDFNDLFQVDSEGIVEQLGFSSGDFVEVICLGRQGKKFYYFSTETKQVVDLSADQHSKNYFLTMADAQYWADLYGYKYDKDGNETDKPDWDIVQEKVLTKQRAIGFFNPKNVRGYGCWFDEGELVVNFGDNLLHKNELTEKVESKYLYESGDPLEVDLDNPLSNAEARKIPALFKKLNYKNKSDFIYLVSWIGQAQIFGALDWRFQAWLTGSRGSGKTEILRMVANFVFNSEIYQSVTAASIRQHLRSNALPMIIDEAEPNNQDERRRMDGVIELIRQCSSRINTKTLRGTTSGTALEYNVNSVFLLSSIQTYLPTMADKSRFFEIEMADNKNQDPESWIKIQNDYSEISSWAPRLFARFVNLIPVVRENIASTKKLLTKSELVQDKRSADQLAVAIAVYFAFYSDGQIDPQFVVDAAEALNLGASEYENANAEDEAEKCLEEIMGLIIDRSVGRTIESCLVNGGGDDLLAAYGIKMIKGNLFIHTANVELKKLTANSMYSNLTSVLKRHPSFIRYGEGFINKTKKGVHLKWSNN